MFFIAGALLARIAFWLITNRVYEDGLTTVTHARNVPLGLGLVHHLGEGPVHGFTSALSVSIPLVGELVHQGSGIFTMRIASLVFVCVALIYARLICRDLGLGTFPTAFVLAYLAFDQNMIFYGMSGMETQVAVAILLAGIYHVRRQDLVASGVWLGLAPLVRPDFVLWVAPALVYLAITNRRRAAAAAGIAMAVVAPWLVFATAYYGSPIPNTIIAKSTINPTPPILAHGSLGPWIAWLVYQVHGHLALLVRYLEPFRGVFSTSATPLPHVLLIAIALAVLFFLALGLVESRRRRDLWPLLAFLGLFFAYRIYFLPTIPYFDWYMPPFLGALMIVVAVGMQRLSAPLPLVEKMLAAVGTPRLSTTLPLVPKTMAVVLSVAFAMHMPFSFPVERNVQSIENQVRTNVGLYLRANVQPGQSVTSESAGYVGYFGGVKLYDYPGLTSKTSVRALQSLPPNRRTLADLISVLQPDWLVLRPWELDALQQNYPAVAAKYQVEKVFEMPGVPESELNVRGASSVSFGGFVETDIDLKFIVLKRTSP
ncbi:MAG TPA: hypothetical protein VF990_14790 [Candidatus Dormibacteraeota bacterium]